MNRPKLPSPSSSYASAFARVTVAAMCFASVAARTQTTRVGMVDVSGYRLHFSECGSGKDTVVFESGLGEDFSTWNDVQPQVAQFAHTVVYDRAGLGKSDMPPFGTRARTVKDMAHDLHSLLHAIKASPPYLLVGHSLGGTIVQVFAHSYPGEVAGLVLVDPEDSRLVDMLHSRMSVEAWASREKAITAAMSTMPPGVRAEQDAAFMTSGVYASEALPLPTVPVILLTGTKKNPEFPGNPLEQDLKLELHNTLLAKIPHSKHLLAPNSRHYIQNDDPGLVVKAISELLGK
ncbi:MAG: alpha/beta hydrolase [Acidobacteriota bacterium]|nr:alpha/beta hydrolase [Acidobacteriota bacterium]